MPDVTFYFDYRSPYAYMAHHRLTRSGIALVYRPFEIRALMEQVGNVPTSVVCKAKNRYVQADLRRCATRYGVPFSRHPDSVDLDAPRLLRATLWAASKGPVANVATALFDALWSDEHPPLRSAADVMRLLERAGVAGSLKDDIDAAEWRDAVEEATAAAAARGVFGAPCMFVGDELFFGNDRVDFVLDRLEHAA